MRRIKEGRRKKREEKEKGSFNNGIYYRLYKTTPFVRGLDMESKIYTPYLRLGSKYLHQVHVELDSSA